MRGGADQSEKGGRREGGEHGEDIERRGRESGEDVERRGRR